MAVRTAPGVYVEEIPSGVRTITGVATSITAFVGPALRGPTDEPVIVNSFADYDRAFGGLAVDSPMSFAVRHFFQNGGGQAVIVRVIKGGSPADIPVPKLPLVAASPGEWGNDLSVAVDHKTKESTNGNPDGKLFNLMVTEKEGATERFLNLSVSPKDARFVGRVLEQGSTLVRVKEDNGKPVVPDAPPEETPTPVPAKAGSGKEGTTVSDTEIVGKEAEKTGLFALNKTDLFNLLCIAPAERGGATSAAVYQEALRLCAQRRALLLVDLPQGSTPPDAAAKLDELGLQGTDARNAAVYFPWIRAANPLFDNAFDLFPPSGAIAGVMARTDARRGVWKAPAGVDAAIAGILGLELNLNEAENGQLNPLGINCLRSFPLFGRVVWGARTLRGADQLADEYKYLPVRRLALFLEESLYRGTQWVVFEPNDEPLWSHIRLNVGAFMDDLFRQGAFQGTSPDEAYFVKCDSETTTQNDINLGIVNVVIGFAPLKPAEFVVLKIQQIAGPIQS